MKVFLITSSFLPMVGGAEIVVHNLAAALSTLGLEVTVVAPRYSASFRRRVPYCLHPVLPGTFPLLAWNETLGERYFLANLTLLRLKRFDVVNLHFVLPLGPVLVRSKRLIAAPVVLTFHGGDVQKEASIGYGLRLDPRLERKIRLAVNGSDGLVAISESIRQSAVELLETPKKIFDIPNGVDIERFKRAGPRGAFRRRIGLPNESPLVLAVGRNHPKKGFRYLVEAMRHVADADPAVRCAILGRGASALHNHVQALSLSRQVVLVEEVGIGSNGTSPLSFPSDDVVAAYKDSDIFVSPSLIEGCSLSVIEALAAGLPAVATDAPGEPGCDSRRPQRPSLPVP